ncbi:uncharacterized protein BX664DRAFT_340475 [Halteromyces radiatus]|uniref:uncharacterized protein n=1 Tax=Halteromyces radiatus TaxID=101107 RepID=UPI00221E4191|nr:uncharacterized protein BX664DRAFT_340475 [Halteromyces radiatus]KAI8081472.1 hypothetical protein BX664DRAFT_340475 [Halteromyces radiatus]
MELLSLLFFLFFFLIYPQFGLCDNPLFSTPSFIFYPYDILFPIFATSYSLNSIIFYWFFPFAWRVAGFF